MSKAWGYAVADRRANRKRCQAGIKAANLTIKTPTKQPSLRSNIGGTAGGSATGG